MSIHRRQLRLWVVFLLFIVGTWSTREDLPVAAGGTRAPVEEQDRNMIISDKKVVDLIPRHEVFPLRKSGPVETPPASIDDLMRGDSFLTKRDYENALLCYENAASKNPELTEAYFQIGFCDANLGRYQEAIEAFKRAVQIKPDYAEAYLNLGSVYGRVGRYQEALDAFAQAVSIDPDLAEAYGAMGWAYHKLGRVQEEVGAYEQAVRIRPDYAEAHLYLGAAYLHMGDRASAVAEYRILKNLNTALAKKLFALIAEEKR